MTHEAVPPPSEIHSAGCNADQSDGDGDDAIWGGPDAPPVQPLPPLEFRTLTYISDDQGAKDDDYRRKETFATTQNQSEAQESLKALQKVQVEHEDEVEKARKSHKERMEGLTVQLSGLDTELARVKSDHARRSAKMESVFQEELHEIRGGLEKAIEEARRERADLEERRLELSRQRREMSEAWNARRMVLDLQRAKSQFEGSIMAPSATHATSHGWVRRCPKLCQSPHDDLPTW